MVRRRRAGDADPIELTYYEGSLLGVVLRNQPVTAYALLKVYEQSPVTSFNTSKGSVYPLIKRLKAAGLLEAEAKVGRGRNPEALRCTPAGVEAVRAWVKGVRAEDVNLDDPLRTMLLSFPSLSRDEQIEWVTDAKAHVAQKLKQVEEYSATVTVPFQHFAHRSAVESLRLKMEWLDDLQYEIVKGSKPPSD